MSRKPLRLGYWNVRGEVQPARLLLQYLNVPYTERRYLWKLVGDKWDKSDWLDERLKLGLDFPTLPWLKDPETGVGVTGEMPVIRYICDKYGPQLLGETPSEKAFINSCIAVLNEFGDCLAKFAYGSTNENSRERLRVAVHNYSKLILSRRRGDCWLTGSKQPTLADFYCYEKFDIAKIIMSENKLWDQLETRIELETYLKQFEALPHIAKYLKSDDFVRRPIFGANATFR